MVPILLDVLYIWLWHECIPSSRVRNLILNMLNTLTEIQVANIGVVPLPLRLYGAGLRFCACSRLVSVSFALLSKASLRHFTFTVLSPVKKRSRWFICRHGRYSVNDKNLAFYFIIIYVTTLPRVKEPFSPKQHSKFSSLAGLQNLWFNRTLMVPALLFSGWVLV